MTGNITWEQLVALLGIMAAIIGTIAAVWFRVEARINEAMDLARKGREELQDYKLEVSKDYASVGHLREVEERLVSAIQGLTKSVDEMPTRVASIMKAGLART